MTSLLDDHLLLAVLLGDEVPVDPPLATTGSWYHRLARARVASPVTGALSRRLGDIDEHVAAMVVASVTALPPEVELVSLRDLAGPMAQLVGEGVRLDLLSLEAVAAAERLGATICLGRADLNPPLVDVAEARGVPVEVVGV